MRFIKHPPDFDMAEQDRLAEAANVVYENIALSNTTADNITEEDRQAVRDALAATPLFRDLGNGMVEIKGVTNLQEGRDWCFATNRRGAFGVYSLEPPLLQWLDDAIFHHWTINKHGHSQRIDYAVLGVYQDEVAKEMLLHS